MNTSEGAVGSSPTRARLGHCQVWHLGVTNAADATAWLLQAMATAFAERKVMLKQRQAELEAQARFLAGEAGWCA